MLPNPAHVLASLGAAPDSETARYQLVVPPLVHSSRPVTCNQHRVTVEAHIVAIVQGNMRRIRPLLGTTGRRFDVVISLLDTHQVPDFQTDLGFLADALRPNRLRRRLKLDADEIGVTIEERGSSPKHDRPAELVVGICRQPATE